MHTGNVTDEIKEKLDIVQVISEYVQLKKAGTRMVACCPFHNERTPSFSVSPDMGFWYCFGCNEGGDIFSFIQRIEGLDFAGALQHLAEKAGVELRHEDAKGRGERQRLLDANRLAAKFFHEVLLRSPKAQAARAYVARRDLGEGTVEDFSIGFSPDSWDATMGFLKKRGFTDIELLRAGLVSRSDRGRGYFDRFRGRLMFPIRDVHGNVVGFTGRVMPRADGTEEKEAKYVNTQQTPVYDKSAVVFGLDRARKEIRRQGVAVVVEGNMDVISSHQAGVTNVVATSGTAFTEHQLRLLRRFADRLVLSFDGDAAGEKAARRGIDLAVKEGFSVRILRIPDGAGKDPDDCIRKDPALWKKAIADAVPYMAWYIALAQERTDLTDPDAKRDASAQLLAEIAKMGEPVERAHWVKELSQLFDTPESTLFEKVEALRHTAQGNTVHDMSPSVRTASAPPTRGPASRQAVLSEHLLGACLAWPEVADPAVRRVDPTVVDDEFRELYKDFTVVYTAKRTRDDVSATDVLQTFMQGRDQASAKAYARARLRADEAFNGLSGEERKGAVDRLIGELESLHKSRRQRELAQAMAQAEKAGDMRRIQEIHHQLKELI